MIYRTHMDDARYMVSAGFWRRLAAFCIDTIPINLLFFWLFYSFLGYDQAIETYLNGPKDFDSRLEFAIERDKVRDATYLFWIAYCMIAEASPLQGTFGKRIMGLRVVNEFGRQPSLFRVFARNAIKPLSWLPLFLGFLWIGWSKTKQGWHDKLSGCYVVRVMD